MTPTNPELSKRVKPRVVLSGVNLREFGPLAIFRDALASLASEYSDRYELVALVHKKRLFETEGVTYLEFPDIASSWLARLRFEFWSSRTISRTLAPRLWLSMHDITPNVVAESQAVYCHNGSPFRRARFAEFFLDPRYALFTLFYRFLYQINISSNRYVIVQQDWMRKQFSRLYGIRNIIVANPIAGDAAQHTLSCDDKMEIPYRFFYPGAPRTIKNFEVCLEAARILETRGFTAFELWLTFDASGNKYAKALTKKFGGLRTVRWYGTLSRKRVFELYAEADCLLFSSKLETWGLPISEFRAFGRPILVSDLAYAHETTAGYELVRFFDPDDAVGLADLMVQAAEKKPIFRHAPAIDIGPPYARNWKELWEILLEG